MRVYVDTSALLALYERHPETEAVEAYCLNARILISRLTLVEFRSAVLRNKRKGNITLSQARQIIEALRRDASKYLLAEITPTILRRACDLVEKYSAGRNLRSLDAVQLAAAVELPRRLSVVHFVTLDTHPLADIARHEGFSVKP